jgi:hypothetical protein
MRPVLFAKTAFDAAYAAVFQYVWNGSRQFKNELIIQDVETNNIVYQVINTTFVLTHELPAGTLVNGNAYTAEIIVYDMSNIASEPSEKIYFRVFTTPSLYIMNLYDNQIIKNSSYELQFYYDQPEGEPLKEYQIKLYNLGGTVIFESGYLYPVTNGMSYILRSLLDNNGYYVELSGITRSNMIVTAPKIPFSVEYTYPSAYSKVILENLPLQASVKIQSNLILIEGVANHEPVKYIDGEKVDLTADGEWLEFMDGFSIDGDFTVEITGENFPVNKVFFEMNDKSGYSNITVEKNYGDMIESGSVQEFFVLYVTNGVLTYRLVSNLVKPLAADQPVSIVLRRKNNLYSLAVKVFGN